MKDVERYLQAGTRENTRRSYQQAVASGRSPPLDEPTQ